MCNLFYAKKDDDVDPTRDEVKQIIIFDANAEHHQFDRNMVIEKDFKIGIQTILPYPKAYEFLKNGKSKNYSLDFFIRVYPE